MLVVTELDDPFLPLPDDLLVNLTDSRELVDALLDALPNGYTPSTSNDVAMGPALQVGGAGAAVRGDGRTAAPGWALEHTGQPVLMGSLFQG
jgi:hypothetical protein